MADAPRGLLVIEAGMPDFDERLKILQRAVGMTDSKVEQVARAICMEGGWCKYSGRKCNTGRCTISPHVARAAIAAMREPTEAMINAGGVAVWDSSPADFHDLSRAACRSAAIPCWQAMHVVALEESD